MRTQHPVDRGWSWVMVAGGMLTSWLMFGMAKSKGFILLEVVVRFEATASEIATIVSIFDFSLSLSALLSMGILSEFLQLRVLIMAGGVVMCVGYSLVYAAYNIYFMYLYALLAGSAAGMSYAPCQVLIIPYFKKRRTLAVGIIASGISVGVMTMPIVFNILTETYAFKGAMLFLGGLSLHIIVFGALMRPVEFYHRERVLNRDEAATVEDDKQCSGSTDQQTLLVKDKIVDVETGDKGSTANATHTKENIELVTHSAEEMNENATVTYGHNCICGIDAVNDKSEEVESETKTDRQNLSQQSSEEKQKDLLNPKCENLVSSSQPISKRDNNSTSKPLSTSQNSEPVLQQYHFFFKDRNSDKNIRFISLDIFKNIPYLFFIFGSSLFFACMGLHLAFLPLYVREIVDNVEDIAVTATVFGVFDFFGRIFFGFLGDCGCIKRYQILSGMCIASGVLLNTIFLLRSYAAVLVYCGLSGILISCFSVMTPVVIVDFFGQEQHAKSWALIILLRGFISLAITQTIGVIREQAGSYGSSFNLIGCTMIVGSVIWLTVMIALLKQGNGANRKSQAVTE